MKSKLTDRQIENKLKKEFPWFSNSRIIVKNGKLALKDGVSYAIFSPSPYNKINK